jgi:hypothetical protein
MKRTVAALCFLFLLAPTALLAQGQGQTNANWRALVQDAFAKSDLVVQGTVVSVRDETERDGGHVYELKVTGRQKGPDVESVAFRAGGYFYTMPLSLDESVLIFLKAANRGPAAMPGPPFSVVEADALRPMAFRSNQGRAAPVDGRLRSEFDGVTSDQVDQLLQSLRP